MIFTLLLQKSAKMKAARGDGIDGQHSRDAPVMVKRRSRAVATGSEAASLERSKESVSNRAATTKVCHCSGTQYVVAEIWIIFG